MSCNAFLYQAQTDFRFARKSSRDKSIVTVFTENNISFGSSRVFGKCAQSRGIGTLSEVILFWRFCDIVWDIDWEKWLMMYLWLPQSHGSIIIWPEKVEGDMSVKVWKAHLGTCQIHWQCIKGLESPVCHFTCIPYIEKLPTKTKTCLWPIFFSCSVKLSTHSAHRND